MGGRIALDVISKLFMRHSSETVRGMSQSILKKGCVGVDNFEVKSPWYQLVKSTGTNSYSAISDSSGVRGGSVQKERYSHPLSTFHGWKLGYARIQEL